MTKASRRKKHLVCLYQQASTYRIERAEDMAWAKSTGRATGAGGAYRAETDERETALVL